MRSIFVGCGLATVISACSLLVATDREQCNVDSDCSNRGGAFGASTCVEHLCTSLADAALPSSTDSAVADSSTVHDRYGCQKDPRPEPNVNRRIAYTRTFANISSGKPLTDITVRLCNRLDPNCNTPRTSVTPNADGSVTFDVEYGFDGFMEATGPSVYNSLIQVPPVYDDRLEPPLLLVDRSSFEFTAGLVSSNGANPDLAHIFVRIWDCDEQPVENATIRASTADPSGTSRVFYLYGVAARSDVDQTDQTGRGGVLNLPPGETTLTSTDRTAGKKIGELSVGLRKGFITYARILPTL